MGIWIRSQDKAALVNVNSITRDDEYENSIVGAHDGYSTTIGTYATQERALQVLDEIQGRIWESVRTVTFPNDGYVAPIFEMPTE